MLRPTRWIAIAALVASAALPALAAPAAKPAAGRRQVAVFAGGCFWSMQKQFEGVPGVVDVVAGYTGGSVPRPSYEDVCTERTGHVEAVQVTFDPAVTRYETLLDRYWHSIDPTQADGGFCDIGPSYRSAIFAQDDAQRRAADASKAALARSGVLKGPIATRIAPAAPFWRAEEYHQDYWRKNRQHYDAYREGCGRDRRLRAVWGDAAAMPLVH